jgi:F-type H+-transporting ATPase subunit a
VAFLKPIADATHLPIVVVGSLLVVVLLLAMGFAVRSRLARADGGLLPDEGLSVRNVAELLVEMLAGLAEQNMGPNWRRYFPIIGSIFFFILTANLIGLIPGIAAQGAADGGATRSANVTWAWAAISFLAHQYVGIKEHGFSYVNHFLGPSLFDLHVGGKHIHVRALFPLYAPIELLSHLSRLFTLAVRLLANMFADHLVVTVWISLVAIGVPAIFMGLGVMVAFLQAYVFAMLSMIYIGLALEEAH